MGRFLRLNLSSMRCRTLRIVLSLLWIYGLFLGALLSFSADSLLSSTMLSVIDGRLSIISFLSALLLPLFFTVLAVYISQPVVIFLLIFMKAFLFSFVGIGLLNSFDSSAWLLRCLLMFSDSLLLPILWWIWLQSFSNDRQAVFRFSILAAAGILLIGCIDYTLVAPFLDALI